MQGGTRNCPSRSLGIGRRNGEINKAAAESGVPGFYFTIFMFFMVKCICSFSCPANSQVSPATAGCLWG